MVFLRLEPLEERIVLDGAIAVDVASPHSNTPIAFNHGSDTHVVVISESIAGADFVAQAAKDNVKVVVYDPNADDLNALSQKINAVIGNQKVESIAFFTGGNKGEISLFTDISVNKDTIQTQMMKDFWRDIGTHILSTGSVDILGCNVAGDTSGINLVNSLDSLVNASSGTHINVNASTDLTGNSSLGGNWILEYSSSTKASDSLSLMNYDAGSTYFNTGKMQSWEHVLAPEISLSGGGTGVTEGGAANFTNVALTEAPTSGVVVLDITTNGSSDLTLQTTQMTFTSANFSTAQVLQFQAIDDSIVEGTENFQITVHLNSSLTTASNYLGVADQVLNVSVIDNDPTISISNASVTEGGNLVYTVTLNTPSSQTVQAIYDATGITSGGTARSGSDYTSVGNSAVIFAPGEVTKTITIITLLDSIYEGNETLILNLHDPLNATIGNGQGIGTIIDDDPAPRLSINNQSVSEGSAGGIMTFTVTRIGETALPVTFNYSAQDNTALAGSDYAITFGTATILANSGTQGIQIIIPIVNDTIYEQLNESFFVNITEATNIAASGNNLQGIGNIFDNDPAPTITVSSPSVNEGAGTMTFTVTRNGFSDIPVTFVANTGGGTATAGSDYTAIVNQVGSIPSGGASATTTIVVPMIDDALNEVNETFTLTLSSITNASLPGAAGTGTIIDNDPQPTIVVSDTSVTEGENLVFTVGLSAVSSKTITVQYRTQDGGAVAPGDYTAITTGTLTFAPGDLTKTITVTTIQDGIYEGNETLGLILSFVTNANLPLNVEIGTIIDDDPAPTLSINDATIIEGTSTINFTVTRTGLTALPVNFTISTADNTAIAGSDYIALTNFQNGFAPGGATATFTFNISISDDTIFELPETFFVNLTGTTNIAASGNRLQGIGTINDNDTTPTISINNVSVNENASTATFTVTRTGQTAIPVTFLANTVGISAATSLDYTALVDQAGTIVAGGVTGTTTVTVPIVDDIIDELNETFNVILSSVTNVRATGNTFTGLGTIIDNDPTPTISVFDASVTEGGNLVYNVSLSGASSRTITVNYVTANGTAIAPADYTALSSATLTFAPGVVTQTVTVTTIQDTIYERNEGTFLNLSSPTNATIADNQALGTIIDDDPAPIITINDLTVNESAGTAIFTVTRAGDTALPVNFTINTADNTAIAGSDYTAIISQAGSIAAGGATGTTTITVSILNDAIYELAEAFFVNLSGATNVAVSGNDFQGFGTIIDNDAAPTIAVNDVSVNENAGTATFIVTRTGNTAVPVSFFINTSDGIAVAPGDYIALVNQAGTVVAGGASATTTFTISIVDDLINEVIETYSVNLSSVTNVNLVGNDFVGLGTIIDNDPQPSITISDTSVTEGGGLVYTVSLSAVSAQTVTVNYATADQTALAPGDYTAQSGTLTFNPGDLTKIITVTTIQDTIYEGNETTFLNLTSPTNAIIADNQAFGTIIENDVAPTIAINDVSVNESAGTATFTVTRIGDTALAVNFLINTSDGTALATGDYIALVNQLGSIAGGGTSGTTTVTVSIVDDLINEVYETYNITLSNVTNVNSLGNDFIGLGTITDNDPQPTISITDASVTESGNLVYNVSLSALSGQTVSVQFGTVDQTAVAPGDYTVQSGTLIFNPGDLTKTITVATIQDTIYEGNEITLLNLSSPINATIADNQAVGNIIDDDAAPTISVDDVTINEGAGTATFTVTRTGETALAVNFLINTSDDTGIASEDYTAIINQAGSIAGGGSSATTIFTVSITDDLISEASETYNVVLSNITNINISGNDFVGLGTVIDNDTQPSITISDASVTEGGNLVYTVSLSAINGQTITVLYDTANQTAFAPGDYTAKSGILTFNPGDLTKTITVTTIQDTIYEGNETTLLNLTSPTNATITDNQAVGTIIDNDSAPTITINDVSVNEGAGTATFTVTRNGNTAFSVDFLINTSNGTAVAAGDYTAIINQAGTIAAGGASATTTMTVSIIDDLLSESLEAYNVILSNVTNVNASGNDLVGLGTIIDNDSQATISITDASVTEGGNLVYTVSLSAVSGQIITLQYSTADQTALAPGDYIAQSGTLTFNPGDLTKTITVTTIQDTIYEGNETTLLNLISSTNAAINDNQAVGAIIDDDAAPIIAITDVNVNESSGTATFIITRTGNTALPVDFLINTLDGAALAPGDYIGLIDQVGSIAAGGSFATTTVTVSIIDDLLNESLETYNIILSNVTNVSVSGNDFIGLGTIIDNDVQPSITISDTSVIEGGNLVYTVSLSAASGQVITVQYDTGDQTAFAPGDYTAKSGILLFNPGDLTKTITVGTIQDTTYEGNETTLLNLTSSNNAAINDNQAFGTIVDNDAAPIISINDVSVNEGAGTATFTVTRNGDTAFAVDFLINTSDGIAIASGDYISIVNQSGSIAAGGASATTTFTVSIIDDLLNEGLETYSVLLSNVTNVNVSGNDFVGLGTITDNDPQPTISITDTSVIEGGNLVYTVSLSAISGQTISVQFATADQTALAPADYIAHSGTLTFSPGDLTKTITVTTIDDTIYESNERTVVNLSLPTNATIADNQSVGTIIDNDVAPTISVDVNSVTVNEDVGTATFTVTRTGETALDVDFLINTSDGSAIVSGDYIGLVNQQGFIGGGGASATTIITVAIIDDLINESTETFNVTLSSVTNINVSGNNLVGLGTIIDNDSQPTISITDASVTEGGNLIYNVSLSAISGQTITVHYGTADQIAVAPGDYIAQSGTLTFNPGDLTKTIILATVQDTIYEGNETTILNLTSQTNATIADNEAIGTIIDDDSAPIVTIVDSNGANSGSSEVVEGNFGSTNVLTFNVLLSNASFENISFSYSAVDGTATLIDDDYTQASGQIFTILAGQTSASFTVAITGDLSYEANETVGVNLDITSGAVLGSTSFSTIGVILNDDAQPTISISDATVVEGGNLVFTVSLSNSSYQAITVDYITATGTALEAQDYLGFSVQTLIFAPGEISKTITVFTIDDAIYEGATPENMFVNLTNAANATIADNQAHGNIVDNDAAPRVTIVDGNGANPGNAEVLEGNFGSTNVLTFNVSLSNASFENITFSYSTVDVTAILINGDYTQASGQIFTILAGQTSASFTVAITGDLTYELSESLGVNLAVTSGGVLGSTSFSTIGVILNDDAQPTISISDANVVEGGNLVFTISLSNPSYQAVTVDYITATGTALNPQDYLGLSIQTLTFAPGQTSKTITISTIDDTIYEGATPENMFVNLSNAANATIADNQAQGNIIDSDVAPTLTIVDSNGTNPGSAQILEGNLTSTNILTFNVSLSNSSYENIYFSYSTVDGTATLLNNDYTQVSGQTFTILAGQTSGSFTVAVNGDLTYETNEILGVNLTVVLGRVEGNTSFSNTGVIINDDPQPTISIDGATVVEGGNLVFTTSLSNASYESINVDYVTLLGTAFDPQDYLGLNSQTLTFAPGQISRTITISTIDDNNYEGATPETMFVQLNNSVNATITVSQTQGNILDNDADPNAIPNASPPTSAPTPFVIPPDVESIPLNPPNPFSSLIDEFDESLGCGLASNLLCNSSLQESGHSEMKLVDAQINENIFVETEIGVSDFQIIEHKGAGLRGYFTIYISVKPDSEVLIDLETKGISQGSVTPSILIFTPENWNIPQVVEVNDPNWNPEQASEIITNIIKSGDVYKNIEIPHVSIPVIEGAYPPINEFNQSLKGNQGRIESTSERSKLEETSVPVRQ